jgi:hypothetical protein
VLGTLLRLTLLASDINEAILDGRQPASRRLPQAAAGCRRLPQLLKPFPTNWNEQRALLITTVPSQIGDHRNAYH